MRTRATTNALGIALGSVCFLAALSGCGGGAGGTSGGGSTLPAAPASSGTSPTSLTSPYPYTDGATLTYSGQLTQTFQSFPKAVAPSTPPEPPATTNVNVTQIISEKANQSFNGGSGLYDLHSAETDADASGLKTTTSTTDTYETIAQNGATSQLLNYGSQFADESGDTQTTSYSPSVVLDQLPETAGTQWSNGAGATVLEALAGNSNGSAITVSRTVHTDGTYTENTTYPPGYSYPGYTGVGEIQENTDGSGTYAWVANASPLTLEYSAPVPQLTGPALITIGIFAGLDPTSASAPNAVNQLPTWYGAAPAFYNETDRDLGVVSVPSSCALSSTLPQQATEIVQTINRTDTILGYTEAQTTTNYVASGYGTLCTTLQDTQTLYYDFNGDQARIFTTTPPFEISMTSETLTLQPSPAGASATARRMTTTAMHSTPAFNVSAALRSNFDRLVNTARLQRARALTNAAQRNGTTRGAK